MQFKISNNNGKYQWTKHALFKMQFYGLSPQRITRVIKSPARIEEGIVKNTVAVMQPVNPKILNGKKIWKHEIWVMYQARRAGNPNDQIPTSKQIENYKPQITSYKLDPVKSLLMRDVALPQFNRVKIISAWRYPGVSPQKNPIPGDILAEIESLI